MFYFDACIWMCTLALGPLPNTTTTATTTTEDIASKITKVAAALLMLDRTSSLLATCEENFKR